MRASDLLTIDVESELRRLAEAVLEGSWQVPTELVRRAVASGARRVEVQLSRGRVVVQDDGRPLLAFRREALERLLDPRRPPSDRHAALVALEAEPELLTIAALKHARVRVSAGPGGTAVTIDTAALDVTAARHGLESCTRFAPCTIVVGGRALPRGFRSAFAERALEAPLHGRLALTGEPSVHLWLLAHGVVSSHLTLPDTPAFEAAIELGGLAGSSTPALLREAIEPHLGSLVDQAVRLMLDQVAAETAGEDTVCAMRTRLLVAARRGWRRDEILRAPLVRVLGRGAGRTARRVSLLDLGTGRTLPCLDPHDDPAAHLLPAAPAGPVVVLGEEDRGTLATLLRLRFRPVPRRVVAIGWRARVRRWATAAVQRLGRLATRLRHPGAGRALAESAMSAEERAFVRALAAGLRDGATRVVLTDGAAPPHRDHTSLRLPRRHPDVSAAIRAVTRDPSYLYAAVWALQDEAVPSEDAARAWRSARGLPRPPKSLESD